MQPNKPLHIFVDCHVFDGPFQGTTTYLKGLYQALIAKETMHFYLAGSNVEHLRAIFGEAQNVTYLKYRSHNKFVRLLFDIPALIRKHKIDFAHFQYVCPPIKACKYIVTVHDVLFLDYPHYFPKSYQVKNRFLFELSARRSDLVLTVSEYSKARIAHHFKTSKIVVTPNGVDPNYFEDFDRQALKAELQARYQLQDYWLYVSRWEPRKNHYNLLRTFVEFKHYEKFQLVFIGSKAIPDPLYDRYYENLPQAIKSRIFILNAVPQIDFLPLLRGAALSAYPSLAEGFGIPPLESAAALIPTVCSNTTAMADFDFFGDQLFDPLDPSSINKSIAIALLGKNTQEIRKNVSERFHWNIAAAIFYDAVRQA